MLYLCYFINHFAKLSKRKAEMERMLAEGKPLPEYQAYLPEAEQDPDLAIHYFLRDTIIKLKKLRKEKGISQEEMAEKMGTKQTAISRFETYSGEPGLKFLLRYILALKKNPDNYLLSDQEDMNSKNNLTWEEILSFKDSNEKIEHEADMISLKIAIRISEYLEERAISKKDLAKLMGTSPAYITQILRGDKRINMIFLARLMDSLDLRFDFTLRDNRKFDEALFDRVL